MDGITRHFLQALRTMNLTWPVAVEAPSTAIIMDYVARGHGVGVTVAAPKLVRHPGVRFVPLAKIPSVPIVALWRPTTSAAQRVLCAAVAEMKVGKGARE